MPGGRPKAKIDKEQLEKLAEKQWSIEQIAAFFRVSRDTIERRFAANIKEARQRGGAKLIDLQWKRVLDPVRPSDRILIHMSQHYLGQTDKVDQNVKVTGDSFVSIDKVSGGQVVGETILLKKPSDR